MHSVLRDDKTTYTVSHEDTHDRLFPGSCDRRKALAILGTRKTYHTVDGQARRFVLSEWYVTEWDHSGREAEIIKQTNAQEFYDHKGDIE